MSEEKTYEQKIIEEIEAVRIVLIYISVIVLLVSVVLVIALCLIFNELLVIRHLLEVSKSTTV